MYKIFKIIEIIKSKRSMDPLGRISLKNTKKALSQPYCKIRDLAEEIFLSGTCKMFVCNYISETL